MAELTIDPAQRTLRGQVSNALREALLSGRLVPGQRVNEAELAGEIGVSRGTLRESLRELEKEGLLASVPHRGTFVRELSLEEIAEVYDVMAMLETHAACLAAANLDDASRTLLRARLEEFERVHADESSSVRARVDSDLAFHDQVFVVAANAVLHRLWHSLQGPILAIVVNAGPNEIRPIQAPDSHRALFEALASGDADRITTTWNQHFERAAQAVLQTVGSEK